MRYRDKLEGKYYGSEDGGVYIETAEVSNILDDIEQRIYNMITSFKIGDTQRGINDLENLATDLF